MPKGAETLHPSAVVFIERFCTPRNIRGINRHLKKRKQVNPPFLNWYAFHEKLPFKSISIVAQTLLFVRSWFIVFQSIGWKHFERVILVIFHRNKLNSSHCENILYSLVELLNNSNVRCRLRRIWDGGHWYTAASSINWKVKTCCGRTGHWAHAKLGQVRYR